MLAFIGLGVLIAAIIAVNIHVRRKPLTEEQDEEAKNDRFFFQP